RLLGCRCWRLARSPVGGATLRVRGEGRAKHVVLHGGGDLALMRSAPGFALAEVAERAPVLAVGEADRGEEVVGAEGGTAEPVREVDQHRETAVQLERAVGHRDEGSLVDEVAVGVEEVGRRGLRDAVEPAHDLWSDLIDKFPHLRTRFLTVCPCILDSVEKWEMCLNDEVLQWVQSVAEGEEPALAAGAGDEDKPLVLQGKLAHEVEGYLLHPEVGGPLPRNEFVGCGIPMSHPPLRLGAGEEKGPLSPCHHATHVETPV